MKAENTDQKVYDWNHKYYLKHKKQILARNRKWQDEHKERKREHNARTSTSPKTRFSRSKWNAKKLNREWTISLEMYIKLITSPCTYCNYPLDSYGSGLDRIDNDRGYTPDNVLPCCGECNRIRSNQYTVEQMKEIGSLLAKFGIIRKRNASRTTKKNKENSN